MATILGSANQYRHTGRGPLDSKALVKTFADLTNKATWTVTNEKGTETVVAYNGMITAVWLDKDADKKLTDKNGIYFLFDKDITGITKAPDVTNEANWHKLGSIDTLPDLAEQVKTLQSELEAVKSDVDDLQGSATVVVDLKDQLPRPGVPGKIYVVTDDAMTYVWYNNDYLPVGDGGDNAEIQIISGGGPTA